MTHVTVLIPCHNAGRYLATALESVFAQTYKAWRVIVVNDASTDSCLANAERFLVDPRVTVLRNAVNLGQSKAQNIGLAKINTPFVIQLDADDWFMPNTLQTLMNEAQKLPKDIAVIYGNFYYVYQDAHGKQIRKTSEKGRVFKDHYDFLKYNRTVRPRFFRTSCLKAIGGWPTDDPYAGRYVEDRRILLRLIERYRFHWIDQPLYNYRRHSANKTNNRKKTREALEWLIRDTLDRWGNEFQPIFEIDANGLKRFKGLIPTDD
jgi:glycosyltransferase involved in cell wall biosynthesis